MFTAGGSSQQDFEEVLDSLEKVYSKYYRLIRASTEFVPSKSQVVIWNLPGSFTNDEETMRERWNNFNMTYPGMISPYSNNNIIMNAIKVNLKSSSDKFWR